jgi:hypothetical protein
MPHAIYVGAYLLCPWSGCGFQAELVDFRIESMGDPALYARAVASWGWTPGYGLVGRCPGCHQHVLFTPDKKQAVLDLAVTANCDILPDNWHVHADIQ